MSPERVPHEEFAPGVHRLGARLEEVVQGARVRGVEATTVTVVATRWVGTAFLEVTYRDDAGRTETTYLDREREPSLLVERASRAFAFDGDASAFVLAFEALRIGMAAQFDPMVGLSTSDLDPLRTRSARSTRSCCRAPRCGSCSPTTRARARRSWPGSTSRSCCCAVTSPAA